MYRALEGRLFPWLLVVSLAGHAALTLLGGEEAVTRPDFEVEERMAVEPMTVRIITRDRALTSVPQVEAPEQIVTSERGTRQIAALEVEPETFKRPDRTQPELQRIAALEPPPDEPDPDPVIEKMPEPEPLDDEPPPPEKTDEPEPLLAPPEDIPVLTGPVNQEAQSGVNTRATPSLKGNRAPRYPRRARAAKMEGTTELAVTVKANGKVDRIELHRSSGFSILDGEAMKAVKRWRFKPAMDDSGNVVTDRVIVPVTFRLKGR